MARKKNVKLVKRPQKASVRIKKVAVERDKEITKVLIQHQNLRDLATSGWSSKSKPKFLRFLKKKGSKLEFGVIVKAKNAESASISVYRMLEKKRHGRLATKVRKVLLNKNYQAKTIPRRFGQFGSGGHVIRTKSGRPVLANFPGIVAREWDSLANLALEDVMTAAIKKGYKKGFSKL